jgi:hypothetical protein
MSLCRVILQNTIMLSVVILGVVELSVTLLNVFTSVKKFYGTGSREIS